MYLPPGENYVPVFPATSADVRGIAGVVERIVSSNNEHEARIQELEGTLVKVSALLKYIDLAHPEIFGQFQNWSQVTAMVDKATQTS